MHLRPSLIIRTSLTTRDIEQKLLAASQLGVDTVVASKWNSEDKSVFIPPELTVHQVDALDDVLDIMMGLSTEFLNNLEYLNKIVI